MADQLMMSIPFFATEKYGTVNFQGKIIPFAFVRKSLDLTTFVLIQAVCEFIGIPPENEIVRIWDNELLSDGLFLIGFNLLDADGDGAKRELPAISLRRLHTWLALIPTNIVSNDLLIREQLIITQKQLSDKIYAYFNERFMVSGENQEMDDPISGQMKFDRYY